MTAAFTVEDEDQYAKDVQDISCTYAGNVYKVFDDASLDVCFALSDISGAGVLSLNMATGFANCLAYPSMDDNVPLEIAGTVKANVSAFRSITFDENSNGYISDGGVDAYDHGMFITTNVCGHNSDQHLAPWVPNWKPQTTNCLNGGTFQISQAEGVMIFYTENQSKAPLNVWITGDKGNGDFNPHPNMESYESGNMVGWSQCYPERNENSA